MKVKKLYLAVVFIAFVGVVGNSFADGPNLGGSSGSDSGGGVMPYQRVKKIIKKCISENQLNISCLKCIIKTIKLNK